MLYFFGDYTLAKKELGVDLSPLEKCTTREKKYLLAKRIIKEHFNLQSAESLSRFIPPPYSKKWRFGATIGRTTNESQQYQDVTLELYEAFNRLQRILQITPPNIKNFQQNILSRCQLGIIKMWRFCQTHVSFATFHILTQLNTQAKVRALTMKGFTLGRKDRQSRCLYAAI